MVHVGAGHVVASAGGKTVNPPAARVWLVLGVAIAAVSSAAIFIRLADAPGVVVAFWRMAIASLVIAPLTWRAWRQAQRSNGSQRLPGLAPTVAAGVLLALHFATWITSLSLTSVAASVSLVTTTPLWVALFAWAFLRRAPSLGVLLGALLAVAGGTVIALGDWRDALTGSNPLVGDLLALAGAMAMAGVLLLGRMAQNRGLPLQVFVGLSYSVAALVLLPIPALMGLAYLGYPWASMGWMLALALVPQLIGHTGIHYCVRHLGSLRVATAILLEPIGAAILALWLFAEVPSVAVMVGAGLLLSGVLISVRTGDAAV